MFEFLKKEEEKFIFTSWISFQASANDLTK